jgi:hypothetical protein
VFDNVSSISAKMADTLCRVSDSGHPIIINSIDDLVTRADLADRCLFANLALVTDRQRRSQQEIRAAFETMRPKILGVLFDAVAHGLRTLPTTRLDSLPRMADFALWATACEGALWSPGTFMSAYNRNRTEAAEQLIETDLVASAVQGLAIKTEDWSGTSTKLLAALGFVKSPGAPQSPRAPSGQLHKVAPRLCKAGIDVEFRRTGHIHERTIIISLRRREDGGESQRSSAPSAPSAGSGGEAG